MWKFSVREKTTRIIYNEVILQIFFKLRITITRDASDPIWFVRPLCQIIFFKRPSLWNEPITKGKIKGILQCSFNFASNHNICNVHIMIMKQTKQISLFWEEGKNKQKKTLKIYLHLFKKKKNQSINGSLRAAAEFCFQLKQQLWTVSGKVGLAVKDSG